MSIAIIIATHGTSATYLLASAEMIIGQQENTAVIDFLPGENTETLFTKYQEKLSTLDTSKGLLFLVDFWGGSPFNAASKICQANNDSDMITGVNIPMLVELFMARDDDPTLSGLIKIARDAAINGIKTLKKFSVPSQESSTDIIAHVSTIAEGNLCIGLARIDDRLIHGQVATRWTKETRVNRIVVVSDDVVKDKVRTTLLKQVAPPGVIASVIDVDKMVRVYNNPKYANDRVMLLFTNPTDVLRLVQNGIPITSVNIGGMAYREGKTQITNAVSVDQVDIDAFKQLNQLNIELEIRKVSSDSKVNMMDLIAKHQI